MAFNFDGDVGDYLYAPDSPRLNPSTEITVSSWSKHDIGTPSGNNGIVAKASGPSIEYELFVTSAPGYAWNVTKDGSFESTGSCFASGTVSTDWEHLAGTFVASTSMSLYKNGVEIATDTAADVSSIYDGTDELRIGVQFTESVASNHWNGDIADVAIWNVSLDATEVAALAKGASPLLVRPSALIYYVPLVSDYREVTYGDVLTEGSEALITKVSHPRIIYPHRGSRSLVFPPPIDNGGIGRFLNDIGNPEWVVNRQRLIA